MEGTMEILVLLSPFQHIEPLSMKIYDEDEWLKIRRDQGKSALVLNWQRTYNMTGIGY